MVMAADVVNPLMTGKEMKSTTNPRCSSPMASWNTPAIKVKKMACAGTVRPSTCIERIANNNQDDCAEFDHNTGHPRCSQRNGVNELACCEALAVSKDMMAVGPKVTSFDEPRKT
eukprot:m.95297 g.95297  ORF g.95297 m.95297 type:complete len:115 (-) comp15011_c0_seq1:243-587(-)